MLWSFQWAQSPLIIIILVMTHAMHVAEKTYDYDYSEMKFILKGLGIILYIYIPLPSLPQIHWFQHLLENGLQMDFFEFQHHYPPDHYSQDQTPCWKFLLMLHGLAKPIHIYKKDQTDRFILSSFFSSCALHSSYTIKLPKITRQKVYKRINVISIIFFLYLSSLALH